MGKPHQQGGQDAEVHQSVAQGVVPARGRFHSEKEGGERQRRTGGQTEVAALEVTRHVEQGIDPESNPDGKGIEGAHISVVPLTRLKRILVEVDHNGEAGQHEEQAGDREILPAADGLEHQADEAQQEREQVETIVRLVLRPGRGQAVPAAKALGIDEVHTGQPVSVHEIPVALRVVLAPGEVPHEVTQVHPAHLVAGEKAQVFCMRGHEQFVVPVGLSLEPLDLADVLRRTRPVGPLGRGADLLLEAIEGPLDGLRVGPAPVEALGEVLHHQLGERAAHFGTAEVRQTRLVAPAHDDLLSGAHLVARTEALSERSVEVVERAVQFVLAHVAPEDAGRQMEFKGLRIAGLAIERTGEGNIFIPALVVGPLLVLADVVRLARVHAREDHGEAAVVLGQSVLLLSAVDVLLLDRETALVLLDVLLSCETLPEGGHPAVHRAALLVDAVAREIGRRAILVGIRHVVGGVPVLAGRQGTVPVLLTVQVGEQGKEVFRVVLVHRRVGRGAHHDEGERAVADEDHRDRQGGHVELPPPLLPAVPQSPDEEASDEQQVRHDPRVEGQAEAVDEGQLEARRQLHEALDQAVLHEQQQGQRQGQRPNEGGPLELVALEVVDRHDGRDGEEVEQVDTNRQAHQVGNEHDPPQIARLFGAGLPLEDGPEDERREQGAQGVHLTLDGAEPEAVAERVGQGPYGPTAEDGKALGGRRLRLAFGPARHAQLLRQVGDAPEQEEDGERARHRAHHVDRRGRIDRWNEHRKEARDQHEHRSARGVSDLELVGRSDELPAIPEAGGRFDGQEIDDGGHQPHRPSGIVVESLVVHADAGSPGAAGARSAGPRTCRIPAKIGRPQRVTITRPT